MKRKKLRKEVILRDPILDFLAFVYKQQKAE